jgi:prophage endopeptidase
VTNAASRQADLVKIANAGAAQARQAIEQQQAAEQALANLDQKAQKEKIDGLAENEKLRSAAADSASRLRIAGSCRAVGGDVPSSTSPAGLGDAGAVELSAASESTVFDIRAGIIAEQAALKALQSVCGMR